MEYFRCQTAPYKTSPNKSVPREIHEEGILRAKSLLSKLQKEKRDRDLRKHMMVQKQREIDQKIKHDEEQRALDEQERRMKEKEMKRVIIKQRLEKREQDKLKQKELLNKTRTTIIKRLPKVPLYMKLQKKFHEDYEVPELQKRKEELKKIREMRGKPLDESELKEHKKRYDSIVRQRMAELEEERMRKVANADYDPNKYKTRLHQQINTEDAVKRREYMEKLKHKKLLAQKKMSYGDFVSQVHKPAMSMKKKVEMENLIDKLKHPIKETHKVPNSASYDNLYNRDGQHPWSSIKSINATHLSMSRANIRDNQNVGPKSRRSHKSSVRRVGGGETRATMSHAGDHDTKFDDEGNANLINIDNYSTHIPDMNNSKLNETGQPPRKLIQHSKNNRFAKPPRSVKSSALSRKFLYDVIFIMV